MSAVVGEVLGTGVLGALASWPVMRVHLRRSRRGLVYVSAFFYFGDGHRRNDGVYFSCRFGGENFLTNAATIGRRENEEDLSRDLDRVRRNAPLIHCLTNPMTGYWCAQIILSAGESDHS